MNLSRVAFFALVAASFPAHAGSDRPSYALTSRTCMLSGSICHLRASGPATGVGNITAEVASERGVEDVTFVLGGKDALGAFWEAKLALPHEGAVDVSLRVEDTDGDVLSNLRTSVSDPWDDGGYGVGALPLDDDPLTTVALLDDSLAIASSGWTLGDTLPTHAEVRLADGSKAKIPANSYQRRINAQRSQVDGAVRALDANPYCRVAIDGRTLTIDKADLTLADLSTPVCAEGTCVSLVPNAKGYGLSVTQYRWDTAFPSDSVTIELSAVDEGGKVVWTSGKLEEKFGDDVTVVFAQPMKLDGDPVGGPLSGSVRLTEADGSPLAQGRFHGIVMRDEAGELDLGATGVADTAALEPTFAVLFGSEPSPCGDDEGWGWPPPVLAVAGNGSGTKNASSQASTRPQLL